MMSATFFTNLVQKKETKEDWGVLDQHDWYWKSLNLTEEDWLENYTLWSLSWVLNVFDHTMTEKLPFLRKEDTDHQIELEKWWKKVKSTLRSLYNMMREATSVAQDINRTFE
jgi:hypothetical protein